MVNFFIQRPVLATVLAILITLIGAITIPVLPIAQFPQIAPPTVQVSSTYTGASSEVVEKTVTVPIEEEINGVEGMTYMSSNSSNDGSMNITVTFQIGYDLDIAAVDVQNRVELARPRLPEEVSKYGISVNKQSTNLVLVVHLISPDGSRDGIFLSNYIDIHINDVLKRIPGVGNTTIFGERLYSMRVWLDPDKLSSLGLTAMDVANVIRDQNQQVAAGAIGQPPVPPGQSFQLTINTLGRLSEVKEFENIVVRANSDGSVVRIKDVATVDLGAESYSSFSRLDGKESVALGIFQLPGANAIGIDKQVRAAMEKLSQRFPAGVEYKIDYDTTTFVKESIKEVLITLFEAFVLVFIVVFAFLQSFRATLIPAITIPVSLIGTFALMAALGFSINTLTLFGLVLAVGLVVDDAIVVVENVSRMMQDKGLEPRIAAMEAMKEVTGPIVATSLVLMAVFVPVSFMPGITGQLYRQFALTIACSVGISAINALTLSPALCALFLRPGMEKHRWVFAKFNIGFDWFRNHYKNWLRETIGHWKIVLTVFVILIGITYILFRAVPTGFVPEEDQGYFIINIQGPGGSSLQRTTRAVNQVEDILNSTAGIEHVVSIGGLNIITSATDSNSAAIFAVLAPWSERKSPNLRVGAIISTVQKRFNEISDAVVVAFNAPPIRGLSELGGFQFELQDLEGQSLQTLYNMTQEMIRNGNKEPDLTGLFSTFTANIPELYINLDRTKAKTLGVSISDVFSTLQAYLGALYVNDFNKYGRVYRVFMQAQDDFRTHDSDISRLYTRSATGDMIPLSTLVDIKPMVGAQTISHYNMYRSAEIDGGSAPGYSSGQALQAMERIAKEVLPRGMSYEWTGTAYQELKAGNLAPLIFALSLVFVFLFLAALYESWSMPFMIMLAVPLALLGAMFAQWVRGLDNDVYSQIGLVMLIGLASKNAILIVEFARRRREEGEEIIQSAIEAARIRLRPILMTAFAFILGVLPLVIAGGAGARSRHSLGTAVFGGMIASTFLSLIVVPVFYVLIEKLRERRLEKQKSTT